jgi:hypothetical protein
MNPRTTCFSPSFARSPHSAVLAVQHGHHLGFLAALTRAGRLGRSGRLLGPVCFPGWGGHLAGLTFDGRTLGQTCATFARARLCGPPPPQACCLRHPLSGRRTERSHPFRPRHQPAPAPRPSARLERCGPGRPSPWWTRRCGDARNALPKLESHPRHRVAHGGGHGQRRAGFPGWTVHQICAIPPMTAQSRPGCDGRPTLTSPTLPVAVGDLAAGARCLVGPSESCWPALRAGAHSPLRP